MLVGLLDQTLRSSSQRAKLYLPSNSDPLREQRQHAEAWRHFMGAKKITWQHTMSS